MKNMQFFPLNKDALLYNFTKNVVFTNNLIQPKLQPSLTCWVKVDLIIL